MDSDLLTFLCLNDTLVLNFKKRICEVYQFNKLIFFESDVDFKLSVKLIVTFDLG